MTLKDGKIQLSKSLYFLHIPKTGGRFIANNIFTYLGQHLSSIGFDTRSVDVQFSHKGVYLLKQDQYSFSFFRDPIERAVSHYAYFDGMVSDTVCKKDISTMMESLVNNKNLHNYQSKYLSYRDENIYENFYSIDFPEVNVNDVKLNISKLDRFHKTSEITGNLVLSIFNDVQNYLALENKMTTRPLIIVGTETNSASKVMYSLLSESEKKIIAEVNAIDMEIYNTAGLFTFCQTDRQRFSPSI